MGSGKKVVTQEKKVTFIRRSLTKVVNFREVSRSIRPAQVTAAALQVGASIIILEKRKMILKQEFFHLLKQNPLKSN